MSEEKNMEKLQEIGLDINREKMKEWVSDYFSAVKLANDLEERQNLNINEKDDDFYWIGILALWEKWWNLWQEIKNIMDELDINNISEFKYGKSLF